ncbi:MAG: hypothetical protein DCC73_14935 [Proteobacteria bacterium]|nr:MAG: hypothetical protein DCC73_14935 [Pseudomonadota bacterium]
MSVFLSHALAYAALGWPVFPCHPNDKRPLIEGGFTAASLDPAQIRDWWRQWPDAMIGAPTGRVMGGGHFVIDIDPPAGQDADAVIAAMARIVGPLPGGLMARTPRGGLHLYFHQPMGQAIGNRAHVIDGVDVRGDGGYVILPPSVRRGPKAVADGCEGVAYAWEDGHSIDEMDAAAPSPEILRFVMERRERPPHSPLSRGQARPSPPESGEGIKKEGGEGKKETGGSDGAAVAFVHNERVRKFALSALESETRAVAQAGRGQRNTQLNLAALKLGQLIAAGALSEATVRAALTEAAAACGLIKDDGARSVALTIDSGLRKGKSEPRDLSAIGRASPRAAWTGDAPWPDDGRAEGEGQPPDPQGERASEDRTAANSNAKGAERLRQIVQQCAAEPQNDTGNGRRLRLHFGEDFLFVRDVGAHVWTDSHWEAQGGDECLVRLAQETAERIHWEAANLAHSAKDLEVIQAAADILSATPDAAKRTGEQNALVARAGEIKAALVKAKSARHKFAISSGNSAKVAAMVAMAAAHATVRPEDMDADPMAINVANGTLRLVKETVDDPDCPDPEVTRQITRWRARLGEHRREDRLSKVMPVAYDPDADCPRWREFVERFQPKAAVRRFLQAFHGYALTGLTGEQVFVFNYGLGANGKSTFMEALARLMGAYAQVLPAEALTGDMQRRGDQATPEFARLPGARLVRCAELPRGQWFRESTLKMLTGGEAILVRHLHARFFEFRPIFKAIGSGNDKPQIGGVDEGIWRRMRLIPWEVTIPPDERRPMEKVLAEFMAEGPGILNWLLEGALDYLENGLIVPPEIASATDDYRAAMDPVGEFTGACVTPAPGNDVTARDMYLAYVAWCHANSVKAFSEKAFAAIMTQKGFEKESGRIRKYKHVALKDVPDDPELTGGRSPVAPMWPD